MTMQTVHGLSIDSWCTKLPVLRDILAYRETCWFNPAIEDASTGPADCALSAEATLDATRRLERFRPYIARVYPETVENGGRIESPLVTIPAMQRLLSKAAARNIPGSLLLKCDNLLPISGSVKARGGIYEVLKHAETIGIKHGLLQIHDPYTRLASEKARTLFARHRISVGSTGNLGLSIGIMGASFGFQVSVHMSADARQWKKELLRSHGVQVIEYESDYGEAVAAGRAQAAADPFCHFVDDENSTDLFYGYSVAGPRLQEQLETLKIRVDQDHPLFVYLPCGVGGAPGGITFGLKQIFGNNVHCFFAEPTHAPCMLTGLCTGLHDAISVQDFELDSVTDADGLAVGRPSGFIGRIMTPLIAGAYTVSDTRMYRQLAMLADSENSRMEPSALAGMDGIVRITGASEYLRQTGLAEKMHNATHIAWGTGGSMVPQDEMDSYYRRGKAQLTS